MRTDERPVATTPRRELAAFLQACRKRLSPQQVGLPPGERRRVKGLRREEVAALSGIGITWYTWLEQGRDIQVSEITLSALAQALRLSEAERTYLFLLASPDPSHQPLPIQPPLQEHDLASLQTLLDALHPHPALLRDHHWDILAWNEAEAELVPWASIAASERNLLVYLFTDPHARKHLPRWQEYARSTLQIFRLTFLQFPQNERLTYLLDHLHRTSKEFRQWWQEQGVQLHPALEVLWWHDDGKQAHYTIQYLTFPLHPTRFVRVLFPSS